MPNAYIPSSSDWGNRYGVNTRDFKQMYKDGRYPDCYKPYPPFYNICVVGAKKLEEYFVDMVELEGMGHEHNLNQCKRCFDHWGFIKYWRENR